MPNSNFKIYGIILIVIAVLVILNRYYYYYIYMPIPLLRYFDWGVAIACGVIGIQLYRSSSDLK